MPALKKLPKVKILDNWRPGSVMGLPALSGRVGGSLLPQPTIPTVEAKLEPVSRQEQVAIAMNKRARLSGWGEPYNLSTTADASRIQAYLRAAERGDTWQLFTLYRDMMVGYSHLQNEFAKRKLTVVGQPHVILPWNKKKKEDLKACEVIEQMIAHCDNWMDALDNMLDATLWPVAVGEKLFEAVEEGDKSYDIPVRFRLRKIDPVSPTLFCYKIPYLVSGFGGAFLQNATTPANNGANIQLRDLGTEEVRWNPDDWEPELRFFSVFDNGYPDYSPASTYPPDKNRHLIHRGTNLSKTIRDNFGGHMRAILFWWFLATSGRDWFGRYMQRWAHPFIVGKVDAQQKDTVAFMQQALSMAVEIGGLVIDKDAEAMLLQAASLNGAEGYKLFLEVCNDEVSKVVVGQTLSSSARATGLGSGVAQLHGQVRQEYRQSDMRKLSATLVQQLFHPYLYINQIPGRIRGIIWGGKDEQQVEQLSQSVKNFKDAGLQPDDAGIETISERCGISFERAPEPIESVSPTSNGSKKNPKPATPRSDHDNLKREVKKLKAYVANLDVFDSRRETLSVVSEPQSVGFEKSDLAREFSIQ